QGGRGSEVRHRGVTVSVWGSENHSPSIDLARFAAAEPLGTAGSRGFRVGYERGAAADERLPRRREGRRRAGRMAPPELAPGGSWVASAYRGMSADNIKGLVLALSSSAFIGASFIIKKKGLKKAAASGVRAGEENFAS
ncbi:hypothetical protein B296_00057217, partial [Ensete ventricosum]